MKIYILGSGFIGKYLLNNFSCAGYDVSGFSSQECNLLFPDSIGNALSSITKQDIIILTSFITRLKENSSSSMIKNIKMVDNISQFIEKKPIRQLIFLSTTDIYGSVTNGIKITEKNEMAPTEYYSISKLCAEFILRKYCSKNNIALAILRLPGVYGPGDEGKSTINKLVESAINGNISIYGDGEDKRDFIYVADIYKIIEKIINKKADMTINLATGMSYSIKQLVEIIKSHCPIPFRISYESKKGINKERSRESIFDISLFNNLFPDFQFIDLKEGISLYIAQFLNKQGEKTNNTPK